MGLDVDILSEHIITYLRANGAGDRARKALLDIVRARLSVVF